MKSITIILLILLSGCVNNQHYPYNYGNAIQAYGNAWTEAREKRKLSNLQKEQLKYYKTQNANAYRNY